MPRQGCFFFGKETGERDPNQFMGVQIMAEALSQQPFMPHPGRLGNFLLHFTIYVAQGRTVKNRLLEWKGKKILGFFFEK